MNRHGAMWLHNKNRLFTAPYLPTVCSTSYETIKVKYAQPNVFFKSWNRWGGGWGGVRGDTQREIEISFHCQYSYPSTPHPRPPNAFSTSLPHPVQPERTGMSAETHFRPKVSALPTLIHNFSASMYSCSPGAATWPHSQSPIPRSRRVEPLS